MNFVIQYDPKKKKKKENEQFKVSTYVYVTM